MRRMYSKPQLLEAVEQEAEVNGLKAFENIVDKDGHKRFIEGEGEEMADYPAGFTTTYSKWSLSGNHLMLVLAGTIEASSSINTSQIFKFTLPQWIYDKLYPSIDPYLDFKSIPTTSSGFSTTDTFTVCLVKQINSTEVRITALAKNFAASKTAFRIAFDFIIDNE